MTEGHHNQLQNISKRQKGVIMVSTIIIPLKIIIIIIPFIIIGIMIRIGVQGFRLMPMPMTIPMPMTMRMTSTSTSTSTSTRYGHDVLRSGICKSASSLSQSQSQSQSQTSATEEEGIGTVTLNNDTNTAAATTTTTDYDDDTAAAAAAAAAISEDVDVANESLLKLIIKSISQYNGIEPLQNKVHCPFVYHNGYSNVKDWPLKHTFPMMKFEKIANALLTTSTSTSSATTTTTTCSSSPTSPTSATATITTASPSTSSTTQPPLVRSRNDFFSPPDFPDLPIDDWLDILYSNNNNNNNSNKNNLFGYRFLNGQLTKDEERQIGFREQTSKKGLIERTFLEIGGTILTTQLALKYGIAANLAGGTHHAHPNGGAGYTILNDLAITSKLISLATTSSSKKTNSTNTNSTTNTTKVKTKTSTTDHHDYNIDYTNIKRILVIDCDVHQGDGTAQYSTLWKKDKDNDEKQKQFLFTLSIHCESNYPFIKYNSTYDVGLQDHCTDEEYMTELKYIVNHAINEIQPDIILYDAGVDVYKYDTLGRIDLSEEYGIRLRDRYVIEKCVSMNIPIACVVGGGYDKDIDALGRRHAILHEECAYVWQKYKLWERRQ